MPPKARITKDMIISAAVEVARRSGFESINARTVSGQLHCSTQPVMYHFSTIDSLKKAAYRQADQLHTQYMMNTPPGQDPILGIGMNYSASPWRSRSFSASCFSPDTPGKTACWKW